MELFINDYCHGRVKQYYQNRKDRKWFFEMEQGFVIIIPFEKIKIFNSSGLLDIVL